MFHADSQQSSPNFAQTSTRTKATEPSDYVQRKARILIVDDNTEAASLVGVLLTRLGYEVALANSGFEALELAEEVHPMCVLLDINLPGMDGFEVARRFRQLEHCADATIIGVSAFGEAEDLRRSEEAGFDYHLIKPVEPGLLSALVSKAEKRYTREG